MPEFQSIFKTRRLSLSIKCLCGVAILSINKQAPNLKTATFGPCSIVFFLHSHPTHSSIMAHVRQLPCNGDGMCMQCKETPLEEEKLFCKTCITPWHVTCLAFPPESLTSTLQWNCPDCTGDMSVVARQAVSTGGIVAEVMAIEADALLTESEKARRRQELMSGKAGSESGDGTTKSKKGKEKVADDGQNDVLNIFGESLNCAFCIQLPERPVSVSTLCSSSAY